MNQRWPTHLLLVLGIFVAGCWDEGPDANRSSGVVDYDAPPDSIRQLVEQKIEVLNAMRESLAMTIDTQTVDKSTFSRVCKPVGQRARQISTQQEWTVQQLAEKYRNPAHKLDPEAQQLHDYFLKSPEERETWIRTSRDGTQGWRYARRITVQSSCLACHGPRDQRPDFVKSGYPEDRAHGFEEGDLRGIYTVFVPDTTGKPGK